LLNAIENGTENGYVAPLGKVNYGDLQVAFVDERTVA